MAAGDGELAGLVAAKAGNAFRMGAGQIDAAPANDRSAVEQTLKRPPA